MAALSEIIEHVSKAKRLADGENLSMLSYLLGMAEIEACEALEKAVYPVKMNAPQPAATSPVSAGVLLERWSRALGLRD